MFYSLNLCNLVWGVKHCVSTSNTKPVWATCTLSHSLPSLWDTLCYPRLRVRSRLWGDPRKMSRPVIAYWDCRGLAAPIRNHFKHSPCHHGGWDGNNCFNCCLSVWEYHGQVVAGVRWWRIREQNDEHVQAWLAGLQDLAWVRLSQSSILRGVKHHF